VMVRDDETSTDTRSLRSAMLDELTGGVVTGGVADGDVESTRAIWGSMRGTRLRLRQTDQSFYTRQNGLSRVGLWS
jgi:hypothetical protein